MCIMIVEILQGLVVILEIVEIVAVTTIGLIAVDIAFFYYKGVVDGENKAIRKAEHQAKHRLRTEKEAAAHEGFFEESYVRGFDASGAVITRGVRVPTAKALEYFKKMDQLADEKIFLNTEEI